MKKPCSRVALALAATASLALAAACATPNASQGTDSTTTAASAGSTRTVTDVTGATVDIPATVTRVAPLVGPGFEKIILLDGVGKVSITGNKMASSGWAKAVAPEFSKVPIVNNAQDPNVEDLISKDVQVVFFWDTYPEVTKKMVDSGMNVLVTQMGSAKVTSVENFVDFQKKEAKVFADALGDEHQAKFEKWAAYYDEKVALMRDRLATVNPATYPKVYYVRGPEALSTHGGDSYTRWLVDIAGGNLVTKGVDKLLYTSTMEDVVKYDPEYIFMGRMDDKNLVLKDPAWQNIAAVKAGKVYLSPKGVGPIDYSSENILLALHTATVLHPDLFKDIDMKKEAKNYFKQFYGYDMTDQEADLYLAHKDPVAS